MEGVTCAGWGPRPHRGGTVKATPGEIQGLETGDGRGGPPRVSRGVSQRGREPPESRGQGLVLVVAKWGGHLRVHMDRRWGDRAQVNCLLWGLNAQNRVITGDCGDQRGSGRKAGQELLWDELQGGQAD